MLFLCYLLSSHPPYWRIIPCSQLSEYGYYYQFFQFPANSNLSGKADKSEIELTDYATISNADGWSVNYDTGVFEKYCKISNGIVYFSAPVRSFTSVAANTGASVATLSKSPSHVQTIVGRHVNADGNGKGTVYGYINRGGAVYIYSTSAIVSGDTIHIKSVPSPW